MVPPRFLEVSANLVETFVLVGSYAAWVGSYRRFGRVDPFRIRETSCSSHKKFTVPIYINPSAWGHLNPSSYCDVGRLFYGVFKLWFNCREQNEEIISRNSLPHYKRASSFTNKREAAWLHLLPNLSRYRQMSESVQHAGSARHSTLKG